MLGKAKARAVNQTSLFLVVGMWFLSCCGTVKGVVRPELSAGVEQWLGLCLELLCTDSSGSR